MIYKLYIETHKQTMNSDIFPLKNIYDNTTLLLETDVNNELQQILYSTKKNTKVYTQIHITQSATVGIIDFGSLKYKNNINLSHLTTITYGSPHE